MNNVVFRKAKGTSGVPIRNEMIMINKFVTYRSCF